MVCELYKRFAVDRAEKAIVKKRFCAEKVLDENFIADVSLLDIVENRSVWNVPRDNGDTVCILNKNYKFLGVYPKDETYAITGIFNDKKEIVELYFDMTKENGNEKGNPYIVDMFLDLVITPTNEKYVLDEDELDEALEKKFISNVEYDLAYETLHRLEKKYDSQESVDKLINVLKGYYNNLSKEIENKDIIG